jgi:type III pantothenate kinase
VLGERIWIDLGHGVSLNIIARFAASLAIMRTMLLVVDVGNTQTHFGLFEGDQLIEHWRFATVRQSTADELGAALRNLLDLRGYGFADVESAIVSSTVPQLEPEWEEMAGRYLGYPMLTVGPGLKTGLAIRYDNPREVGADRLVNAVALRERFGGPAVCVDFGTATTFDVLSAAGDYVGGALMTGIEISLEALSERGARLPKIELAPPRAVLAKNTIDAIRSGVVFGYAGAVDAILRRLYDELGGAAPVVATGGLAKLVVPFTDEIEDVDELLTLTGLRLLHELNS